MDTKKMMMSLIAAGAISGAVVADDAAPKAEAAKPEAKPVAVPEAAAPEQDISGYRSRKSTASRSPSRRLKAFLRMPDAPMANAPPMFNRRTAGGQADCSRRRQGIWSNSACSS